MQYHSRKNNRLQPPHWSNLTTTINKNDITLWTSPFVSSGVLLVCHSGKLFSGTSPPQHSSRKKVRNHAWKKKKEQFARAIVTVQLPDQQHAFSDRIPLSCRRPGVTRTRLRMLSDQNAQQLHIVAFFPLAFANPIEGLEDYMLHHPLQASCTILRP